MKQDPLITYSSLIPGGLHFIPGGLNLPRETRMMNESSGPNCSPGSEEVVRFTKRLRRFNVRLRKTLTTIHSLLVRKGGGSSWLPPYRGVKSSRSEVP